MNTKKASRERLFVVFLVLFVTFSALFVIYTAKNSRPIVSGKSAVAAVKSLPEVVSYLQRVNGLVLVSSETDNVYIIQVFEIKDGHAATFNWYEVNKISGEITKEFWPEFGC